MHYLDFLTFKLGYWYPAVREVVETSYFKDFLRKLYDHRGNIYPDFEHIFRVYEEMDPDDVKVVILGMDPYTNGQAIGRSFATKGEMNHSLKLILKEMGIEPPVDTSLQGWVDQGVLLINVALSVRKPADADDRTAGIHIKYWKDFTQAVYRYLASLDQPITFIHLGAFAKKYSKYITKAKHSVREAPHPASKGPGFLGSGVFKNCGIQWQSIT